ncbi:MULTISPECIES: flagellar hook-basal body protein [unclassified Peribacillus]|uniref:flagellar hook-basal body protein n=1 Tax=unclassified Peribacillus TaxID=2675266 RepID=UPI0019136EE5|nr:MULTISPECIES: flagellar hook-basal body protein [unclassified Peribacillus]MBK5444029.1 flagellar hook-basal body protein [Peribacillus sp. TH24]MBK5461251.1 flagellar hook-basal body protein [Peribacillus sp. TH27]MBK5485428.1 flagellar hook-basal body protein [Peribacillus sp. TH16]MBK5499393.1 flagellar hook-basal body protein [Peribacillus sp. TH14]WMX55514.1 flagellar hook-basal body protein [Peribacillus sp. R9-11]
MLRGFYTAASGMLTQQRRTEMLTNNMSNANTTGFKADQTSIRSFPEMLLSNIDSKTIPTENKLSMSKFSQVGSLSTGVYVQETNPLFTQGTLEETQLNTDLALADENLPINEGTGRQGAVLFTVLDGDGGLRYTRNGSFTLDGQGYLTTPNGYYVLDENNERIQLDSDQFTVTENGVILEGNVQKARLGIGFSDNPSAQLMKDGEGLYKVVNDDELPSAYAGAEVSFSTKQGFLEGSNVDQSRTMTEMMSSYRSFEASQKVLQAYDKSLDKAVNEVGKL